MLRSLFLAVLLLAAFLIQTASASDKPAPRTAREALRPFNDLIGSWHGLGRPEGTTQEKQKGAWEETIRWEWQFKDSDAWLKVDFEKSKYFTGGTLRYLPDGDRFQLTLTTTGKETVTFTGRLQEHRLVLERTDDRTKETQRLVFSLLQDNRHLYQYEVQPEGRTTFRKLYLVGATKEGKPLVAASDEIGPFCVVSYGPPVSTVTYKGKTYYVCCNSCRSEFRADPEKYIKEYEDYLAKLVKEKAEKAKKP
jgi:hypothetical protein